MYSKNFESRRRWRLLPLLACCVMLLFTLVSCDQQPSSNSSTDAANPAADNAIVVGHYASLTGAQATYGIATDEGVRLAVKERNAAGGVNGRPIHLITYDTAGRSQDADTVVKRLITSDKVVALLGEATSSMSLAGGKVAQQYGVPMISHGSTNPEVTRVGDMIFRVCFIDPFQGKVVASFARNNLQMDKVAILYDQSQAYSVGLKDEFTKAFTKLGGQITTAQAYNNGDIDFKAQLTTIRETQPQAIFVPGYYTDIGNIALQKKSLGITVPMLGGDGWDSPELIKVAGDAVEGSYYSNHYSNEDQRPEVQKFLQTYRSEYGKTPEALAALGYDAAMLLFDAMERAGAIESKAIARAIASTTNFKGVTGNITIDSERNAAKSAVMVQIRDGVPVFVANVEPD